MDKAKLFAAAEKAFLKGQHDKALESLEKVIRVDPNDIKALNKAADIYIKTAAIDKALEFLLRVGDIYTKDGFYSKAIAVYKRILKVNDGAPKSEVIRIHEQLASLYGQLGLVSDAMNHFKIVVDFYDQAGDREALLDVLRKVSDLDSNNVDSQLKLAELFAQEGRVDDSIEALERLVENLEPRGHLPELIQVYEKWVSLHPKDFKALRKLINSFIQGGEPKRGLAKLQQAFRQDPYNSEILELLSATFVSMKQPDKARAVDVELVKIYRQNKDEERARELEARLKGEAPPASTQKADQKTVKKAMEEDVIDPGDALIADSDLDVQEKKILSECEVYLKYGLSDKAREVLTLSLQQFPQSIALRWKLKSVCQELKLEDDVHRLLLEMKELAKAKGASKWIKAVEDELGGADAIESPIDVIEAPVESSAEAFAVETLSGIDDSEISIIVEEDDDVISGFQDQPEFVKEDSAPAVESEADKSDDADEIVFDLGEQEPEISAELQPPEISLEEVHEDGEQEFILSEADFSDEELASLQSQLAPEEQKKSAEPNLVEDSVEEPLELVEVEEAPLEILDQDSGLVGIQVSQESGEVLGDREFEIRQAIEEMEFFRTQGLDAEADELRQSIQTRYPDWDGASLPDEKSSMPKEDSRLKKKEIDVDVLGAKMKMKVQEDERSDADEDFFDLAGELDEELEETPEAKDVPREIGEVFSAFKKGVSASVAEDDFQTHYDLGVAYREMGLIEDGLQEFLLCAKIEGKKVSSLYQAGLCEVARENYEAAMKYFDEALKDPSLDQQEKISLSYELGDLLLKTQEREKAAELFKEIVQLDPEFRDAQEKLEICQSSQAEA